MSSITKIKSGIVNSSPATGSLSSDMESVAKMGKHVEGLFRVRKHVKLLT